MKKIERATIHFQDVDKDTGEKLGRPYMRVQNIYRKGVVCVVRQSGRLQEAWHCPTDKIWKCYIHVRELPPEAALTLEQIHQLIGW